MKKLRLLTILFTVFLAGVLNLNTKAQVVVVEGDVTNPFKIDAVSFAAMKRISVTAMAHDGKNHEYSGVSLFDILTKAGAVPNNLLRGKALAKYVLITAADHYQVVIALPETDPAFTDKVILLADKQDGENLNAGSGPYRLIVPQDKKQARSAMRVVSIEVQTAVRK
jgi:hypothetical protein